MTPEEIKTNRKALHLTQEEFSKAIGVNLTTVARWETGVTEAPNYLDLVFEALELRRDILKAQILAVKERFPS